ncbi:DUF72 domain-containing protein [Actinoplanes sp. CA-030573]|uniref:DUF72 domain-containing protein n=1 Tax=Actinoplanes sp. CA-030573 TaxID=3239898 RepID=UPI003D8E0A87
MTVHVGTSGWGYGHWDGVLYPPGTRPPGRLEHYVRRFRTVELNASFYRWPRTATFAGWQRRLPPGFQMSVKAPRGLTHARKLYAPEEWITRITAGLHELGDKRGVFLVQLAPQQQRDDARLEYFLDLLPGWVRTRTAVEFRHPSWHDDPVYDLLERRGVAYCVMSGARLPCVLRATAPVVYLRMHGPDDEHLYAGSYARDSLAWWADRIGEWTGQGREVYVYFNNDGEGNAVRDAETLCGLLPAAVSGRTC